MQDRVLENVARNRGTTVEELKAVRNAGVTLGRVAHPDELAGLNWFLLSKKPGFMTGQAINYSGGYVTW